MTPEKIDDTASKLARAAEQGRLPADFDDDDIQAIKDIIAAWNGLKAFGRLAFVLQAIAKYVGWIVLAYIAVKGSFVDFIRGAVGR